MQNRLVMISLAGMLLTLSILTPFRNPDCGKIAFTSDRDGNMEIYVMDADGSNQTNLTRNRRKDSDPSWSPDGEKIAFVSDRDGEKGICVMNADGTNQINLTGGTHYDWKPAWSPDGKRIAFASDRDLSEFNFDIFVMDTDGGNLTNLTNNPSWDSNPSWSPDGTQIVFTSNRETRWEIYIMNADGSNVKKLLDSSAYDSEPEWSPDGKKIVFYSRRDNTPDIYTINADSTDLRRLTNDSAWDSDPSWSPDGKKIVFYSDRDGSPDIYVMDADGSNIQRLTNDPSDNWSPKWFCSSYRPNTALLVNVVNFTLISVSLSLFFLYVRRTIAVAFILLVICTLPTLPTHTYFSHDHYFCTSCRRTVETSEDLLQEVLDLMEEARGYEVLTPEIEATVSEATNLLNKARIYCFRSQNCIAGNSLAHRSQNILKEAQTSLKSILKSISEERAEEYAVYSALIKKKYSRGCGFLGGKPRVGEIQVYVIYEETLTDSWKETELKDTLQWVCQKMSVTVEQEILDDFEAKNARSCPLGDFFDLPAKVMFIGETENIKIFWKGFLWLEFFAKYPFAQGIMELSRVGFNAEKNQALVYVGNQEDITAGAGYYVLLAKIDGVWVIQDQVMSWIS